MNRVALAVVAALVVCVNQPCQVGCISAIGPAPAVAEETWKREFDEVCATSDDPMRLSAEELKGLIVRCDALQKVIEGLDESTRKVYLKRLRMCKDLFSYVLTVKESEKKE